MIHPTAVIDPKAELDPSVTVGPYALVEGPVVIGPGTEIQGNAAISGSVRMGKTIGSGTEQSSDLFRRI
jgi:UDP-N-acetylglucosamine acyltransferase